MRALAKRAVYLRQSFKILSESLPDRLQSAKNLLMHLEVNRRGHQIDGSFEQVANSQCEQTPVYEVHDGAEKNLKNRCL
jgi:hypothetical protein